MLARVRVRIGVSGPDGRARESSNDREETSSHRAKGGNRASPLTDAVYAGRLPSRYGMAARSVTGPNYAIVNSVKPAVRKPSAVAQRERPRGRISR